MPVVILMPIGAIVGLFVFYWLIYSIGRSESPELVFTVILGLLFSVALLGTMNSDK